MKNIFNIFIGCILALSLTAQNQNLETVKDIDGNIYHTIKISNQVWLLENLKTTRYRNGDKFETTTPFNRNISGNSDNVVLSPESVTKNNFDVPKYQWAYNGDEKFVEKYGRLYTWPVTNDARGLCPDGWRIPSASDWNTLVKFLGGNVAAGGKMKDADTKLWAEPNAGATNESGFTAMPSGGRNADGTFSGMGKFAAWWSSTPYSHRHIEHDDPYMYRNYYYTSKFYGFSVRCIKDK